MGNNEIVITADDVQRLNRTAIDQTANLVRIGANIILVVGMIAVAGWLWAMIRSQNGFDGSFFILGAGGSGDDSGILNRLDLFAAQVISFGTVFLPVAGGLLMRLLADRVQMVSGGSLSGWQPGDIVPVDDSDWDDEPSTEDEASAVDEPSMEDEASAVDEPSTED